MLPIACGIVIIFRRLCPIFGFEIVTSVFRKSNLDVVTIL